jgi:hypothetical protein
MPTLFDLTKDMRIDKSSEAVLGEKITPVPFDKTTGYRIVEAESLASLVVPVVNYNEHLGGAEIEGFQRVFSPFRARKIAQAIQSGSEMPPVLVSIDEFGNAVITDGQHRSIGSMLAGSRQGVVVEARSLRKAQELFANQKLGVQPPNDYLIVAGTGPYNEYVQDALTDDKHVWANIVGPGKYIGGPGATTKIGPSQMHVLLTQYVGDQTGTRQNKASQGVLVDRWDEKMANELASLVACFGNKTTNPEAFKGNSLRAIGAVATLAIRRRGRHQKDIDRWIAIMPQFNFGLYAHLGAVGLTDGLIAHWNKRLRDDSRISRPRLATS